MPSREILQPVLDLVERLGFPAALLDARGQVLFANSALAKQSHLGLVGRMFSDSVHSDDYAEFDGCLKKALQGGASRCRVRIASAGGTFRNVALHLSPIDAEQGQSAKVLAAFHEVCDDSAAGSELERTRQVLDAVLDCLPLDLWAVGEDGLCFLQNEVSRRHWGDAVGKRPADVAGSEENQRLWESNNRRVMAGERIDEEVEAHVAGEVRRMRNIITPLVIDGRPAGVIGVNVDVTDRYQTEQALQRACEDMERRVAQRTAALSATNASLLREIEERRRAETQLQIDIARRRAAHRALQRERRKLMRLLESHDHDRRMIAYELHDGAAQHIAGAILHVNAFRRFHRSEPEQADEAAQAAEDLLALGHHEIRRLISGVRPLVLDDAGIAAAVGQLIEEQATDGGPKIELRTQLRDARMPALVENAAYRIIQESLRNAVQYSGAERVIVHLRQGAKHLRIVVRDWGAGFDPNKLRPGAFGLEGMRARARALGGRCRILSAPGRGTRVIALFPLPKSSIDSGQ